jgi:hypothetical protein
MPTAMRDDSTPPEDDWIGWKAIPSTVTDEALDRLKGVLGTPYPPIYRDFLKYKHFYDLAGPLRFIEHPVDAWEVKLRKAYNSWAPERIVKVGLIPFGDEAKMDAGPACFDTRRRDAAGDCPIVFWDHEWVGTDKEIRPLFSSAIAMFRCLGFAARSDVNFTYHDAGEDDADELPEKQRLLRQFLDLDPDGAGGVALDYWTAWGVEPE